MRTIPKLVVLVAVAVHLVQRGRQTAPAAFEPVADGLYSLTEGWKPLPFLPLPGYPIAVYAVRDGSNWVLVDAGVPALASQLLDALRALVPPTDKLAAIVLTHAHPDHVGALPQLLQAYPDVPVVAHAGEEPFLTGQKHYLPPTGLAARLARWAGVAPETPIQVPTERLRLLEEPLMDFSAYGHEELVYIVSPGHSPGHISLLHAPSRTMLTGDVLSFIKPSMRRAREGDAADKRVVGTFAGLTLSAQPHIICSKPFCDEAKAATSFCLLADAVQYDALLASHDLAGGGRGGWTQDDLKAAAARMPRCQELSRMAAEDSPEHDPGAEYEVEEEAAEEDEYE